MNKIILVFTFLLVSIAGFSQVKFMAGLSGSPNAAVGTFANQGSTTYGKYAQGFSIGGGIDAGVYFGKRFFLLTGLERMGRQYTYRSTYTTDIPGYGPFSTGTKITATVHSWEIPLLANIILSHDEEKAVTCFLSAGFIGGKTTTVKGTEVSTAGGPSSSFSGSGSQILNPTFIDASFGIGAKVNFNEKLSLLLLPDIRYQLTHSSYNTVYTATFRTMLMYNF